MLTLPDANLRYQDALDWCKRTKGGHCFCAILIQLWWVWLLPGSITVTTGTCAESRWTVTVTNSVSEVLENRFFMPIGHLLRWRSDIKKWPSSTSKTVIRKFWVPLNPSPGQGPTVPRVKPVPWLLAPELTQTAEQAPLGQWGTPDPMVLLDHPAICTETVTLRTLELA